MLIRTTIALTALVLPVLAMGHSDDHEPDYIWGAADLAWAAPLHPLALTTPEIEAQHAPPPHADWCADGQIIATPTSIECDDYDADLDVWLIDFMDTSDPVLLANAGDPPSYCGGC